MIKTIQKLFTYIGIFSLLFFGLAFCKFKDNKKNLESQTTNQEVVSQTKPNISKEDIKYFLDCKTYSMDYKNGKIIEEDFYRGRAPGCFFYCKKNLTGKNQWALNKDLEIDPLLRARYYDESNNLISDRPLRVYVTSEKRYNYEKTEIPHNYYDYYKYDKKREGDVLVAAVAVIDISVSSEKNKTSRYQVVRLNEKGETIKTLMDREFLLDYSEIKEKKFYEKEGCYGYGVSYEKPSDGTHRTF